MNRTYGHFDDTAREFVVTDPLTPSPWINYLGNTRLSAFISQQAGGLAWHIEPQQRRLTRYYWLPAPGDRPGFYVYIRDGQTMWNPHFAPTCQPLDRFEARHGLGYSTFIGEKNGIRAAIRYFVPPDVDAMIWDVTVANTGCVGGGELRSRIRGRADPVGVGFTSARRCRQFFVLSVRAEAQGQHRASPLRQHRLADHDGRQSHQRDRQPRVPRRAHPVPRRRGRDGVRAHPAGPRLHLSTPRSARVADVIALRRRGPGRTAVVTLNGKPVAGDLLPPAACGEDSRVEVEVG
jgi:hypothetical protein